MTKQKPKSCSCNACKRGKRTKSGKAVLKYAEKTYRHQTKINLVKGQENISFSPYGSYTD